MVAIEGKGYLLPHAEITERYPIRMAVGAILCGGHGNRLKDVTADRTVKHVLPLTRSQVVLDNPINVLRRAGVRDIYLLTSNLAIDGLHSHMSKQGEYDGIRYVVQRDGLRNQIHAIQEFTNYFDVQHPIIKMDGDEVNFNRRVAN